MKSRNIYTMQQMCDVIHDCLERESAKPYVTVVEKVADYKSWLKPFINSHMSGILVPHRFVIFKHEGYYFNILFLFSKIILILE